MKTYGEMHAPGLPCGVDQGAVAYSAGAESHLASDMTCPRCRTLTGLPEPTDEALAAFKQAWHEANAEGDIGNRSRRGLRAVLELMVEPQVTVPLKALAVVLDQDDSPMTDYERHARERLAAAVARR